MSAYSPMVWSEGMFLRPQHFQQQERSLAYDYRGLAKLASHYARGIEQISLDKTALKDGQIAITEMVAILPDMTLAMIPERDVIPQGVTVDPHIENTLVQLAIPVEKLQGQNVSAVSDAQVTRYKFVEADITDNVSGMDEEVVQLAGLSFEIKVTNDSLPGYVSLPIARIRQVSTEGQILLDEDYVPPFLNVHHNPVLTKYLKNILAMLKIRADAIAQRLAQGKSAASSAVDFIMLQMLNRYEASLRHLATGTELHPYTLVTHLFGLIGELATFSTKNKRVPKLPEYVHHNMGAVFSEINQILSQYLSVVLEQTATKMPLDVRQFGIRVTPLPDKKLLSVCQFVLAVKADISPDEIRHKLPGQIKVGPAENIRDLINNQINGISVSPLSVVPRQMPYSSGFVYFELVKRGAYWARLMESGGMAFHVSGNYPGLEMELWSINQ
ncbi:type VI secretion system baseplate subunit TssK [Vibrio navarrensis]|uniref:Type VI secretion protein n=1 Tax=Vibrio navarrensis TaxID=29495 RepID=A0A099LVC2_9VIBR|nr:type VI secretion system baseplate subunit TssK [Vibrio navarrensis]KGK12055.1 type VI secretion protein [Vibrio navarrensis]MBE4616371.1 type VI secretion system-associated protein [Vibrio navarrensis]QOD67457.1 type VI secretion system baseplate subunit TssK [Vibrio navarrensis]